MSDFVQQNASPTEFNSSDSWVILTPIELSIKRKIESVGVPLKDWNIQINYGIKTGFNDAFIVTTEIRDQILANCKDDEERERTTELIRPILRGRDIKRYGYEWAGLYLIATFPSRHYDIEEYPAVKEYLLSFGMERLEQTGKEHFINGQKVKARKKTNNKWFETQDSISYWDDFSKPKIVYQEICRGGCGFAIDKHGYMIGNTAYILTADAPDIYNNLLEFLNSPYALYQLDQISTKFDETGWRWLRQCIEQIRMPVDTSDWLKEFNFSEDEKLFITQRYSRFHLD